MQYRRLRWFIIILLVTLRSIGIAQNQLIVSGMVVDAVSLEPLPYAHILKNQQAGTTPRQDGTFLVSLSNLDTLTVSHVSYLSQIHIVRAPEDSDTITLAIFLERETTLLPAVSVTPFPATVEDFKQQVMEIEIIDPVKSLRDQQAAITYDIIMGPKVQYDAYENFRRINQPTSFTIFSSGGMKGISRIIKKWKMRKKYRRD